jgi:hypothetical protein
MNALREEGQDLLRRERLRGINDAVVLDKFLSMRRGYDSDDSDDFI